MIGFIKIGDNLRYGKTMRRLGCSAEEAKWRYINRISAIGVCSDLSEATERANDESPMWKDGMLADILPLRSRLGRLTCFHFLLITLGDVMASDKDMVLAAKVAEQNIWDETPPKILSRSKYVFPYWNHLLLSELERVRDLESNYQPLEHSVFHLRDFELV